MRGGIVRLFAFLVIFVTGSGAALAAPESIADKALEWASGGDVFSVARELTIDRKVDGSLSAAGEIVILTDDAEVKGDTWIAARRVAVEGELEGSLSIRAQEALINGEVKGDVTFYGLDLTLGPDAEIDGNVTYYSPSTARIDRNAKVKGEINGRDIAAARDDRQEAAPVMRHNDMRERWRERHMNEHWEGRGVSAPGYHMSATSAVFFGAIALAIAYLAPAVTGRMRESLVAQPLPALGLGLLWLLGLPILSVFVAVTIVGLPVAFLMLLLWPLGMVFGLAATIAALGALLAGRIGEIGRGPLGVLAGVVLATALIWIGISIPILGALIWLLAVSGGIGLLYLGFRNSAL